MIEDDLWLGPNSGSDGWLKPAQQRQRGDSEAVRCLQYGKMADVADGTTVLCVTSEGFVKCRSLAERNPDQQYDQERLAEVRPRHHTIDSNYIERQS